MPFGERDVLAGIGAAPRAVEQGALLHRAEGAQPDLITDARRVWNPRQKAFHFEVEAEILVGKREAPRQRHDQAIVEEARHLVPPGQAVGLKGRIPAQQLVGPIPPKGDCHVLPGEAGEEVSREDGGVGERLV